MNTLSPLITPFTKKAEAQDEGVNVSEQLMEDECLEEDEDTETEVQGSDNTGGLSEWKRIEQEAIEGPQDNGGGLSEWKLKRKRNGLKGRTPKHPLNKRPYTC
jgi:hypothetical protein